MKNILFLLTLAFSFSLNLKAQNKIELDIYTGADNLEPRDFMENPKVTLKIRGRADIVLENINENRVWPNNSINRVTFNLPNDVPCADVYQIILSRIPKNGSTNNISAMAADNWKIQKLTVTTKFMVNGALQSRNLDWISPSGSNTPLYRFVYENRNGIRNEGTSFIASINNQCVQENSNPITPRPSTARIIRCVFGTGGDDLRGGGDNVDLKIKLRSETNSIFIPNLNNSNSWGNFTEKIVTKDLRATIPQFTIQDIEWIELRHTGGGGFAADNWYLDKFKLTVSLNGVTTVLVDKIDAPIHFFTGDTRSKKFFIPN